MLGFARWTLVGCAAFFASHAQANELRGGVPEGLPSVTISKGEYSDTQPTGVMLKCVTQAAGIKVHWDFYPTLRLINMTAAGELDLMYPMGFNAERDQTLRRSDFVLKTRDIWIFKGSRPNLESKTTVKVAVKSGSPQLDYLKKLGFTSIGQTDSYESLLKMLDSGNIDAIAVPELAYSSLKTTVNWELKTDVLFERDVGFYMSQRVDSKLAERINTAIKGCRK